MAGVGGLEKKPGFETLKREASNLNKNANIVCEDLINLIQLVSFGEAWQPSMSTYESQTFFYEIF